MEPLHRSTIWPYDENGEPGEFSYQRFGSPTVAAAEELQRVLAGLMARWDELKNKDVTSINAQLRQANQPVLKL